MKILNAQRIRIAYFAPVGPGGLADYAVCQVRALTEAGCPVTCLAFDFMAPQIKAAAPEAEFVSLREVASSGGRVWRGLSWIRSLRANVQTLVQTVREREIRTVVISAFSEYFAPLWAGPLRKLAKQGTRFGVVVHDPVRDFVIGPKWWHRWSISQSYSFVHTAFVHDHCQLDTGTPSAPVDCCKVPHGPYPFSCPAERPVKSEIRSELQIPVEANVLLSFGHVRDGKNLDLIIRALPRFSDCHLLVAGREQSSAQRPVSWYQQLASDTGVANRCHWHNDFISESDVHRFFLAADFVVLLYSRDFRSASGVLNVCSQFGLPVLASSGVGPLKTVIDQYSLGEWVEPDSLEAVHEGLERLTNSSHGMNWEDYLRDNSWRLNIALTLCALTGEKVTTVDDQCVTSERHAMTSESIPGDLP